MKIIYFTATGNNLHVAKEIGGELLSIPQLMKNNIYDIEDDVVGIIIPCYSLNIPRIVKKYIEKVNIKSKYFFAIITYGKYSGSTINILEEELNKRGVNIDYTDEIVMVDNYLPIYHMEKELKKKDENKINSKIDQIVSNINLKKSSKLKKRFYTNIFTKIANSFPKTNIDDVDKKFEINKDCTHCNTCLNVCPVENIAIINDKITYNHKCEFCLACIQLCPSNAIHLTNEKSSKRFINPNISLNEIKNSNNQL